MESLTYLIIDTNIWIYMANGNLKDCRGKRVHIEIFNVLKNLVENEEVVILTSPIILEEFNRNKKWAYNYVKSLEDHIKERTNYLKKRKDTIPDVDQNDIITDIDMCSCEIVLNKQHIENVDKFLKLKTTIVPLTESVKTKCFDQALAKKAPFTGKKSNSMADMAILLSAIEYVDSSLTMEVFEGWKIRPKSIFISSNTSDFSQNNTDKKENIHPDLQPFFSSVDMEYSTSLGTTLNSLSEIKISNEEIEEMDDLLPYDYPKCPNCASMYEGLGILDQYCYATLIDENVPEPAPKEQLVIPFVFSEEDININKNAPKRESSILLSQCNWCNNQFFTCPVCDSMIILDYEMECEECETKFEYEEIRDRKGLLREQIIHMLKSN